MIDYFFLVFLATIVITRVFLLLSPTPAPTIGNVRIHHYMYGLIAIMIAFVIHSLILYAIGLGLFVDELTYLIIGGKTHKDNYSAISLSGTLILIVAVFFLRNWLTAPF